MVRKIWTEEETNKLRELYRTHTNKELGVIFGCRDEHVQSKAQREGMPLKDTRKRVLGTKLWSSREIAYIKKWCGKIPAHKIASRLNRSFSSVYHKMSDLKLPSWSKPKTSKRSRDYNRWSWIRGKVLDRDTRTCRICGYKKHVSVHHIIPCWEGGNDDLDNLICLCPNCHEEADCEELKREYLLDLNATK